MTTCSNNIIIINRTSNIRLQSWWLMIEVSTWFSEARLTQWAVTIHKLGRRRRSWLVAGHKAGTTSAATIAITGLKFAWTLDRSREGGGGRGREGRILSRWRRHNVATTACSVASSHVTGMWCHMVTATMVMGVLSVRKRLVLAWGAVRAEVLLLLLLWVWRGGGTGDWLGGGSRGVRSWCSWESWVVAGKTGHTASGEVMQLTVVRSSQGRWRVHT